MIVQGGLEEQHLKHFRCHFLVLRRCFLISFMFIFCKGKHPPKHAFSQGTSHGLKKKTKKDIFSKLVFLQLEQLCCCQASVL